MATKKKDMVERLVSGEVFYLKSDFEQVLMRVNGNNTFTLKFMNPRPGGATGYDTDMSNRLVMETISEYDEITKDQWDKPP